MIVRDESTVQVIVGPEVQGRYMVMGEENAASAGVFAVAGS